MSFRADVWSTAYKNDLPDSAFLIIENGGKKDAEGKTTPRSLRHLPVRDKSGKLDVAHVQNAMAQLTKTDINPALQKEAHSKLLAIYKQLKLEHPKCSVPSCQGYAPKKSMLEDWQGFRAWQEALYSARGTRVPVF